MAQDAKFKAAILIIFVSIIAYSNSLGGEFVYDDQYFVVKNLSIKSLQNFPDFFTKSTAIAFADLSRDVYRPITALSYAIDYQLSRLDTFGYHLVNVLFHCANAVLVFILLYALFGDMLVALFAGLFFAVHPVQTEVVSWISGRASVLCLFFYLSSMGLYILFLTKKKVLYIASSIILYAVSLFSKEMAVTLPIMLIAYDVYFPGHDNLSKKIGRYLPYIIITLFFLVTRSIVLQRVSQCGWWGNSPYYTFLTMSTVLARYVGLLIFPLKLCAFYMMDIFTSITNIKVLASIALILSMLAAIPVLFKKHRPLSFSLGWFFITLLPVSNIVPLKALTAERFLYIPSIGFCLGLAYIIFKLKKQIAISIAVLIVIVYSFRTAARNEDWKSAVSISSSIVKESPLNSWGWTSLGAAYRAEGKQEEAISSLKKAIALSRDYATPRNVLGFCYLEAGRYQDAVTMLEGALALDPDSVETMNSLGTAYAQLDRYKDAEKVFKKAIAIDPAFVSAYLNLGAAYEREHRYDEAMAMYQAVQSRTNSTVDVAVSYIRIADLYLKTKSPAEAEEYYRKALDLCGNSYPELRQVIEERLGWLGIDGISPD